MNGLSELILYLIYFLLLAIGIVLLITAFRVKMKVRLMMLALSVVSFSLFFQLKSCQKEGYKRIQKRQVGVYYLTQFPNCKNCFVRLNDNMTYDIVNNEKIIETGNWHHETGQDYFITYMDNDKGQLGSGRFSYDKYKLKYKED